MLFNTFQFLLVFLPITLTVALCLRGQALLLWIVLSSFVFYALAGQPWFLIPLLITTTLDFFIAPVMERTASAGKRKALLILSMCGNLGLLAYFKYAGLFVSTADHLAHVLTGGMGGDSWSRWFHVVLPAGISFYTFQTLSYMIDVYRGQAPAERNFLKFAGFVSFFPHLVAGPLTRHHQLIPGLSEIADRGIHPRWRQGLLLFFIGLNKKILFGDRLGELVNPLVANISGMSTLSAWLAIFGYGLQIYFDFSGYSDMAIGLGRLFGVELPQNFDSPYRAASPSQFWRRWHITLSLWIRDYLFFSLGGSRVSKPRLAFNLFLTMGLAGLWHGAHWTFAIWGLYHGTLLALYHLTRSRWDRLANGVQIVLTFTLVSFGWIFFRAENWRAAVQWCGKALALIPSSGLALSSSALPLWIAAGGIVVFLFPNSAELTSSDRIPWPWQFALGAATAFSLMLMNYSSHFLYFQF